MELYQCVGRQNVSFTAPDGNEINGINLFVVCAADHVDGVKTDKFFISAKARSNYSIELYFLSKNSL